MWKSFTAVARVWYIFFSLYHGLLRVRACMLCVRVYVCTCLRESRWETKWRERGQRREFPKASTFCYAIARSWRRDSIKRRTRHHGRPINPQTQKWIMTFPVAIVHAFYYARCIHTSVCIDFFWRDVYTGRIWISNGSPRVITSCFSCPHCEIPFSLIQFFFYFFILTRTKY